MLTELDLQKRLAAKLPKIIKHFKEDTYFFWLDTEEIITSREWPWIVAEVEKMLTQEQMKEYCVQLFHVIQEPPKQAWQVITATWQQHATALAKIGVI
jgi:hypothetical protein